MSERPYRRYARYAHCGNGGDVDVLTERQFSEKCDLRLRGDAGRRRRGRGGVMRGGCTEQE